ncbi:unnamed protein product, partial [Discosporangium mesarthrocarpum]
KRWRGGGSQQTESDAVGSHAQGSTLNGVSSSSSLSLGSTFPRVSSHLSVSSSMASSVSSSDSPVAAPGPGGMAPGTRSEASLNPLALGRVPGPGAPASGPGPCPSLAYAPPLRRASVVSGLSGVPAGVLMGVGSGG